MKKVDLKVFDLNGHIHTPYSFSAFKSIPQIFEMANSENIKAVGINDFIVTDGYQSFHDEAVKAGVFPLFMNLWGTPESIFTKVKRSSTIFSLSVSSIGSPSNAIT